MMMPPFKNNNKNKKQKKSNDGNDESSSSCSRSRSPGRLKDVDPSHGDGDPNSDTVLTASAKKRQKDRERRMRKEAKRMERELHNLEKEDSMSAGNMHNKDATLDIENAVDKEEAESGYKRKADDENVKMYEAKAGQDRVKSSNRELYVVCEDLRKNIKKIKKEVMVGMEGENVFEAMSKDGDENVNEMRKENERTTANIREIRNGLRKFVLDDANKITKFASSCIIDQATKYEDIIQELLIENAGLRGRIEAYERVTDGMCQKVGRMHESVEKVCMDVSNMAEKVVSLNTACVRVTETCGNMGNDSDSRARSRTAPLMKSSYALIVRGANEDLPTAEVSRRVIESASADVNVRVRNMRPAKGGGVLIQAASDRELKELAGHAGLSDAGLRVEVPKMFNPRVVIFDVPCLMTDDELLRGICEKSLGGMYELNDFKTKVKIIKRLSREGQTTGRVIIEMPASCRDNLLMDGRVYIGWNSFRVSVWERVTRCFGCMSYNHGIKDCKTERLCWNCGNAGHLAKACRAPEHCINCKFKKRPYNHSAVSLTCPEYQWRLQMLRSRINNG